MPNQSHPLWLVLALLLVRAPVCLPSKLPVSQENQCVLPMRPARQALGQDVGGHNVRRQVLEAHDSSRLLFTCVVKSQSNMACSGIEVRSLEKGNRGHVVLPDNGRKTDLYIEILK